MRTVETAYGPSTGDRLPVLMMTGEKGNHMNIEKMHDDLMSAESALHTARLIGDEQFWAMFNCSKAKMLRNIADILLRMAAEEEKEEK